MPKKLVGKLELYTIPEDQWDNPETVAELLNSMSTLAEHAGYDTEVEVIGWKMKRVKK